MYALGKKLRMSVFGKSHAPCVGCVLEGVPQGTEIDTEAMIQELALRKPSKGIGTDRVEKDLPHIVTGVMETPRPGHADLPALLELPKFDITGGGQFSGRLTAPIVAAGSIARKLLEEKGIRIGAFCRSIGPVKDVSDRTLEDAVASRKFPTRACDGKLDRKYDECIMAARADKDSVGGVVECIITGVPIGFGGIWFESLDAELAHAMFGIPACKGVEFGKGFAITEMRGSQSNDAYRRVAFKPTPSIGAKQDTVNLKTCQNAELEIKGRHDPCIAPRAVSVVEAVAALVLADQMERGL